MPRAAPSIHFARSADGTRIAFAESGRGYPLVKTAHWLGNLELDDRSPVAWPWVEHLSHGFRLIRHDSRGCGLSDREADRLSLDALVEDLEAVVDAAGLERFALLGHSQGGAVSMAYAALHPERVSHLVLCGAYARGAFRAEPSDEQRAAVEAMIRLIELGWGQSNSAFVQMFTTQFFPDATLEQMHAFNATQRAAAAPKTAARLARAFAELDASALLPQVRCPTLVLHCRGDSRIPFEEGRRIATLIPDARLQPLESRNHMPLDGEPAFAVALQAVRSFLPASGAAANAAFSALTARERQILDHIARGRDNAQIAAQLGVSEKTVRNNITRIFEKLQVENRAQAIVRSRDAGFGR